MGLRTTLWLVFLIIAGTNVPAAEPPFVPGFDRFATHGDIDPPTAGRLLLTELSCTACHSVASGEQQPKRGPTLTNAGGRLQRPWMVRFLADPAGVKPGTTMPDVLESLDMPGTSKQEVAAALAAYLVTQRNPFLEPKASGANPVPFQFWNRGSITQGQRLYHQVGCIACHEPDGDYDGGSSESSALDQLVAQLDADELAELGLTAAARPVRSVPHAELAAKYTRESLTFFLLDPDVVRPSGRMPNLKLSAVEAADIAAYLLRDQPQASDAAELPIDSALVERGRKWFVAARCTACHTTNDKLPSSSSAKALASLSEKAQGDCVSRPGPAVPRFHLSELQQEAIRAVLADRDSSGEMEPGELVTLRMLQLNCFGCHERDKRGGVGVNRQRYFEAMGHADLGDEGRLPPPLTGIGRKLLPSWTQSVLDGTGDVRPYFRARMPIFAKSAVKGLPQQLARADGGRMLTDKQVFGEFQALTEPGRALLDTGCVQCHPTRGESLPSVLGVDLAGVANRIQPQWFHDFLLDPGQAKPRTRMPTFFPQGQSSNPTILDGNVERQIAAAWSYLKGIDKLPLPDKVIEARSKDFELKPQGRPIVMRTFMPEAGTHAIAVGFPQGVHWAFDAESSQLVEAWRGRFLDAHSTWFDRFVPPSPPLGDHRMRFPAGPPLALLANAQQPWPAASDEAEYRFSGYRIEDSGEPLMLYQFREYSIADRIQPNERLGLRRTIRITFPPAANGSLALYFRALTGRRLSASSTHAYSNDAGLTVKLLEPIDVQGKVLTRGGVSEWRLPLVGTDPLEIKLEYDW